MFLPGRVADALRQIKFEVESSGSDITQGTIVCHALAHAYSNATEWLDLAPADGRRRDADTNLSTVGRRTSFGLTDGLRDATDALLWQAVAKERRHGPAKITLLATGIAWGLSRRRLWLDYAIAHPVMVLTEYEDEEDVEDDEGTLQPTGE